MDDFPRLIEHGFPLRETSLAAVHEKNVRHGHISSLHIWPARRPLAACRAALVATLLPDPGDAKKRAEIFRRLAGSITESATSARDIEGGILRWGNENGPDLQWFRDEIRNAYGGRAPRVLDPFAGGGAIPLEAMRLGCDTTAMDINPVAWFILKCTLEYPQSFAGKLHPLPRFMQCDTRAPSLEIGEGQPGDLATHVRAWGKWVMERARADLDSYYPKIGGKPTVAYLWARTVRCKNCRATIPLLKTRWLCKTDRKTIALTMKPRSDGTGVEFDIAPVEKSQRKNYDASGTMNRSGVRCPCCPAQMTMEELRVEGKAGRMSTMMTAVIVDGDRGKEYRLPTDVERERAESANAALPAVFSGIPFGLPTEPTPTQSQFSGVANYGLDRWDKLFTPRQLLALGTFVSHIRAASREMISIGYSADWSEAIVSYLGATLSRQVDFSNCNNQIKLDRGTINHSMVRFAFPISWDFAEGNPIGDEPGGFTYCSERILTTLEEYRRWTIPGSAQIANASAITNATSVQYDAIITDPPYYDAIPYSDVMDFFYVWLRRALYDLSAQHGAAFAAQLSPKWDSVTHDGELIDDASRFDGNRDQSKLNYEEGMYRAFRSARDALAPNGRMVVAFAHKNPEAWETLVSAMVRAGFVVNASWPIATEMANRTRALSSAALASSIWLVCKKRDPQAGPGWDTSVREEMRKNILERLREFWDVGLRGPDFVWSAVGPALEAFSKYPRVRKVESPDEPMSVSEFLTDVRREVVGFAAARVLHHSNDTEAGIDSVTTYYLLHRNDFRMEPIPVGASILYAVSCNLRDTALVDEYDLLLRPGHRTNVASTISAPPEENITSSDVDVLDELERRVGKVDKSVVQLKAWNERLRVSLGEDAVGRPAPLIDQIHHLMRLWKSGDVTKVNDYIAARGLSSDRRAREVIQAVIELADRATEERSILEALSNHLGDARPVAEAIPALFK